MRIKGEIFIMVFSRNFRNLEYYLLHCTLYVSSFLFLNVLLYYYVVFMELIEKVIR